MKKGTGVPSVTWPGAVDEALCVGWIDGVRHRIDDERYKIRFTPRRCGSHWSNINIRRISTLKTAGRMKAAGSRGLCREIEVEVRPGIVRAEEARQTLAAGHQAVQAPRRRVEVFRHGAAGLPAAGELVGQQRQEA